MSGSAGHVITTPTDHVSLTVVRKSDGHSLTFVLNEKTHVHELKTELRARLKPQFEQGCRLIFRDKVLKGKHSLKHYGIKKGVNDQAISSKFKLFHLFLSSILSSSLQWMTQKTGNHHHHHQIPSMKDKRSVSRLNSNYSIPAICLCYIFDDFSLCS